MSWSDAKAKKAKSDGRKRAIRSAIQHGLDDCRAHLVEELGEFERHQSAKSEFTVVLKTADGEFYLVEVKKSNWEDKQ